MDRIENIEEFNKIWDVKIKPSKNFKAFRNRILFALDTVIGEYLRTSTDLTRAYLFQIGEATPIKSKSHQRFRTGTYDSFADHPLYITISNAKNEKELASYLQKFLWALHDTSWGWVYLENLVTKIKIAIALTDGINVDLDDQSESLMLFPNVSPLLDQELVDKTLQWLTQHKSVCQKYQRSVNLLRKNDVSDYRDIIDNSRLALELLLREVLKNNEPLEDQGKFIGKFLKEANINVEIRELFYQIVGHYAKYNDECIKHQEDKDFVPSLNEVELMVYQAGALMRFLLQVDNERKRKVLRDEESGT